LDDISYASLAFISVIFILPIAMFENARFHLTRIARVIETKQMPSGLLAQNSFAKFKMFDLFVTFQFELKKNDVIDDDYQQRFGSVAARTESDSGFS
jgi:hypothetical protein